MFRHGSAEIRIFAEDGTLVPGHVGVILITGGVLQFVFYCALLSEFSLNAL
jgi:hypothetical protein